MGNTLSVVGQVAQVALSVGVPLGAGFAVGMWTAPEVKGWYRKIKKPTWNPPNWIFGPVWSALYISQGVASYLVFRKGLKDNALTLGLYTIQLLVNLAWNPLFFKAQRIDLALVDIIALDALVAATISQFAPVIGAPATAGLLGPYAGWISFATVLNFWLYLNNRDVKPEAKPLLEEAAAGASATADAAADKAAEAAGAVKEAAQAAGAEATKVAAGAAEAVKEAAGAAAT